MTDGNLKMIPAYLETLGNAVTEVRILRSDRYLKNSRTHTGETVSGYYDTEHYSKITDDILKYDSDSGTKGIYITLHDCHPDLLHRAANRLRNNAKDTTSDTEIKSFSVFPIDYDPPRISGISSSEDELESAKVEAKKIRDILVALGIPENSIRIAMSGNGWHLLIYLNPFENTPENAARFKAVGDLVSQAHGTDQTIYNPSRIFKLYGTIGRKGDNTPERPHRRSQIWLPQGIERIDFETLESIVIDAYGEDKETPRETSSQRSEQKTRADISLREWLDQHKIPYTEKPYKGTSKFQVDCPHDPTHKSPDAWLTDEGGTWQFSCSHNSCKGERSTWRAFKAAHGIADKVYPQPSTQDTPIYTDADIDTIEDAGSSASVPVIPDIVFDGVFGEYRDAFKEKTEVPDAFHFGVLKSIIAGMLGRRVFLDETQPLFPNTYAAVIGETGLARKSTAVNLGVDVMESADETTLFIDTISTPEGLYNMFVQPRQDEDDDGNTNYSGGMSEYVPVNTLLGMMQETCEKEGFRIFAYIDELSATLKKGRKASSEGIVQALLSLYNAPRKVMSPTKTNPTTAYNPCFSLVAATTFEAFQADMTLEDIHAGLANRFEYYLAPTDNWRDGIAIPKPPDQKLLSGIAKDLNALRRKYPDPTPFTWKSDIEVSLQDWYLELREEIHETENPLVKSAMGRADIQVRKNTLIFTALEDGTSTKISHDAFEKAIFLQEYLLETVRYVFGNFVSNQRRDIEERVLNALRRKPKSTLRDLARTIHRYSRGEIDDTLLILLRRGDVGKEKTSQSVRYFCLKD